LAIEALTGELDRLDGRVTRPEERLNPLHNYSLALPIRPGPNAPPTPSRRAIRSPPSDRPKNLKTVAGFKVAIFESVSYGFPRLTISSRPMSEIYLIYFSRKLYYAMLTIRTRRGLAFKSVASHAVTRQLDGPS
jgi:hypothetical protein